MIPICEIRKCNVEIDCVDGIILVSDSPKGGISGPPAIKEVLTNLMGIDASYNSDVTVLPVNLPAGRLIYSPTGNLTDYDDVRSFYEAASKGIKRALKAGVKCPLLLLPESDKFPNAPLVTLLGALEALYVPIQLREDVPEKAYKVRMLNVWKENGHDLDGIIEVGRILESGRVIARDIGGADPERMAPPRVEEYVRKVFGNSDCVKMEVISDARVIAEEYPLFAAVDRAASVIERHRGRIIYLRYEPEGEAMETLALVGKGITYDTGGANIKINDAMTGMSRDKCGAAAVAGFMQVVSVMKPKNVRIIGAMCMARNSVGENAYVADEVITARSKARVRVRNTDAEGRMVMADVLCKLKEDLRHFPNVHLMTVATLTGHAVLSAGPYSIVMDNSVARSRGNAARLQKAGEMMADPFEISVLRREDLAFHKGRCEGDDVHQSGGNPSVRTSRGHQGPAGFLILASKLNEHELSSSTPLGYSHLDIAGSAGDLPEEATGAPILALSLAYIKELKPLFHVM